MDEVQTDRFDDQMPAWTRKESGRVRGTKCPASEGKDRPKKIATGNNQIITSE